MLALGIRYLHGIAVASHGEHGRVEWPPHPARVFMAMVAAHCQTGADAAERAALLWLERQTPPDIYAPDALLCSVVKQYVPVNDDGAQCFRDPATKKTKFYQEISGIPLRRNRQDRTFARASLAGDTVVLRWPDAEPPQAIATALAALCAKVTRIGHSSSLAQMWVADAVPEGLQHWNVDEARSTHLLRVPREGTLEELDRSFNGKAVTAYGDLKVMEAETEARLALSKSAHNAAKAREKELKEAGAAQEVLKSAKAENKAAKAAADKTKEELDAITTALAGGEPRQDRPRISTYAGYSLAGQEAKEPQARCGVFSPHLAIFTLERVDGPYRSLDLACTLALTDRWREALASHANDLKPEAQSLLTGHARDKSPLQSAHVAFLPLGFVGHPHATGHLPGIALALPHETIMPQDVSCDILRVAGRVRELKLGRLGLWKVESSTMARPLETLRSATWTAIPTGATHWSTVTPIAYDHHPKARGKSEYLAEVAGMIRAGCERIGLPQPREVIVTPVSAHLGTPPAHAFPRLRRKDGSERRHTHAILIFDESLCGPVLLGAGRYRGYGLCRPMEL
jgi:CRISPR-associated protein Csb2